MKLLSECPVCSSTKIFRYGRKKLFKRNGPENSVDAENQFLLDRLNKASLTRHIYFCRSCTFLFQNPTFDDHDLKNIYDNTRKGSIHYYKKSQKAQDNFKQESLVKRTREKRQERYAKIILSYKGTKILDYGGDVGDNLAHPFLIDAKKYVYDFGRERPARAGIALIKDLNVSEPFDFILNTHVLEHEPDPKSTLLNLRSMIEPGGTLYLEVPFEYVERLLTRRPGAVWHVNYFNRKTLIELANRTGWRCNSINVEMLPYVNITMNCMVATMSPDRRYLNMYRPKQNILMICDFIKWLRYRLKMR